MTYKKRDEIKEDGRKRINTMFSVGIVLTF